jgi:hypothetical protein
LYHWLGSVKKTLSGKTLDNTRNALLNPLTPPSEEISILSLKWYLANSKQAVTAAS